MSTAKHGRWWETERLLLPRRPRDGDPSGLWEWCVWGLVHGRVPGERGERDYLAQELTGAWTPMGGGR